MTQRQEEMLAEAERVNEERMEIMRELAAKVAHRVDLERQVAEAEKEERRLTAAAEKAGWTRRQVLRVAKPPKTKTTTTNSSESSRISADETTSPEMQSAPADH